MYSSRVDTVHGKTNAAKALNNEKVTTPECLQMTLAVHRGHSELWD